jgi:hypothetical protein
MNCLDCTHEHRSAPAVAVCRDCGAAVCDLHAVVRSHHRTVIRPINRVEAVHPAARVVRCLTCDDAYAAAEPADVNAAPALSLGPQPYPGGSP